MSAILVNSHSELQSILKYDSSQLRSPETVMKLNRLGSFHPTRISFTRTLIRRMHEEKWEINAVRNNLDENGFGDFVYRISTPSGDLSFIAFSNELDDKDRTDRVIAEKWDMAFTLFNGVATEKDVARLRAEVPLQEAGRMSASEIVLSRANKSVRLFESVVNCLANGTQPSVAEIAKIGYLIRTTAVYGNGKFGLMDFDCVRNMTPFSLPFQAEMLTVYMARQFSLDLVHHVAKSKSNGNFVELSRQLQQCIGVGNATGLGMAPYLVGHPKLIDRWIELREIAICRVKSVESVTQEVLDNYVALLGRVRQYVRQWQTDDERQSQRIDALQSEVETLQKMGCSWLSGKFPWRSFFEWVNENTSTECQELAVSIVLELYPELVNELDQYTALQEIDELYPQQTVQELKEYIENRYQWVLEFDFGDPHSQYLFWYFSQGKEEPRLGERYNEPGSEFEMRIGIARDVKSLYESLCSLSARDSTQTVASFLRTNPEYRFIVSRLHSLKDCSYAEIQDNLIGADCRPIDLLRCKLAMFGAARFDPKSNLWTRITLFQGAPLMDELQRIDADDWLFSTVSNH